jgi:hypothetical protein
MRRLLPLVLRSWSLPLLVFALVFPSVAAFTVLGPQFGLAAGALSVGVVLWLAARARYDEEIAVAPSPDDRYRLLVVAARPLDDPGLAERVVEVVDEGIRAMPLGTEAELLVLVPARASRLDRWASDVGAARDEAQRSLALSMATLTAAGLDARGSVGDADAVQAIEDELHSFAARELVIVEGPGLGARELEEVRRRLDRPVRDLG